VVIVAEKDMLSLLQDVALGRIESTPLQVRAAIAAVQYTHCKKGEGGKKDEQQRAAENAASKFARQIPPKLVAKNGKSV
jgi:phage terminase small subunit